MSNPPIRRRDLEAECLACAAASRRMWMIPSLRSAPDRFQDAREWIARARMWRLHAARELAANAAFLAKA